MFDQYCYVRNSEEYRIVVPFFVAWFKKANYISEMTSPLELTIPEFQPLQASFGCLLRALRTLRSLEISELAESSGLSREIVKKIEDGRSNPKLTTLIALAKGLDVDPSCLLQEISRNEEFTYYLRHFALNPPGSYPRP